MGEKYKKKLSEIDAIVVTPDKIVYSKPDNTKKNYKINDK
jgi:hypothetical protein